MEKILFKELSYSVVGAAIEVHRQLGPGFLEKVYEKALAYELTLRKIPFTSQTEIAVLYKSVIIGEYYADLIVDQKIILEIKGTATLLPAHEAQALHYLTATGYRLAMLLNFGTESLQFKRIVR